LTDPSDRRSPPETPEDHAYLWDGARKAHAAWPVSSALLAVFNNWKGIAVGLGAGIALGGEKLLSALGLMP